jgi:hypothetical protein
MKNPVATRTLGKSRFVRVMLRLISKKQGRRTHKIHLDPLSMRINFGYH